MTANAVLNTDDHAPGTSALHHAISNMAAFINELAMKDPTVAVTMRSPAPRNELYIFDLHRGIRTIDVYMPGVPINRVRGKLLTCPRLYLDGNSWWWPYALEIAREALYDHDGAIERRIKASEQEAESELDRQPRCSTCNSVRSLAFTKTYRTAVRCYVCEPEIETWRETPLGTVYRNESWKTEMHYLVKRRHLPPEVPGHEDPMHPDALCNARLSIGTCRLKWHHEGKCASYWKIEKTLVTPDQHA